jgi:anthranilate phosphoribosyltransferase
MVLMRLKGETVEELSTAALQMNAASRKIDLGKHLIDIVGTGGDGKNTFNISTLCAVVAAAAGARVAKHGARSVSSSSGSSDVLLQAGFQLDLDDETLKQCMERFHLCFLFAPNFHPALVHVRKARQETGVRSFFNLLGPLLNPAGVERQVLGVYDKRWQLPLAKVLAKMGRERAMVITAQDGMDEISIAACTDILEYRDGAFVSWVIDPKDYGCYHESLEGILVTSPSESLERMMSVLEAEPGPARDVVVLNSALVLFCADVCNRYEAAVVRAREVIDSGEAKVLFEQVRDFRTEAR